MFKINAEAVAITRTGERNSLNGENFNLNGKVLSPVNADKGYKGAGNLNGAYVLGLCSGKAETRSATTAMKTLSDHIEEIKVSRDDATSAIDRYFDSARRDVSILANDYDAISVSILYAYDDSVIIAGLGKGKCFRIAEGLVETVTAPEESFQSDFANPYYYKIDNITSRNYFLLCSAGIYNYVNEDEITAILEEYDSPKQASQKIVNLALDNGSSEDITLILASLIPEKMPQIIPEYFDEDEYVSDTDETRMMPDIGTYDEYEDEEYYEPESKLKKNIPFIILGVLLVVLLVLLGVFIKQKIDANSPVDASASEEDSVTETEITTEEEPTTEAESTTDGESTTNETTTERESTTVRNATTTSPRATAAPTTAPPVTAAPTTAPPTTAPPATAAPTTAPPVTTPPTDPNSPVG